MINLFITALAILISIILVEVENFGFATLLLIATGAAAQYLHVADIISYATHHALDSFLYVIYYLLAGVAWSFVKWFSFLMSYRDKFRELKKIFLKEHGIYNTKTIPSELIEAFDKHRLAQPSYGGKYSQVRLAHKPEVSDNKKRIIAWMVFWPCSIIGTILNDPVRRLFKLIFNLCQTAYQKLSDLVFANDLELK